MIRVCSFYGAGVLSSKYRLATDLRLQRAGVQYSLNSVQFVTAKCISAAVVSLLVYALGVMLQRPSTSLALLAGFGGYFYPELWLRETMKRRSRAIFRSLPFFLDIITLSIEAGSNLTGGLTQAVQKAPEGALRLEWSRVLRDIRSGKTRAEALHDMGSRTGSVAVRSVINSIVQAEKTGSSLGPVLRAQSDQLRSTRFLQAEKAAMEAPVKLLGPLVAFIFPTTFLVLGFVILSKAVQSGVITWQPLLWAYSWPG